MLKNVTGADFVTVDFGHVGFRGKRLSEFRENLYLAV